MNRIIQVIPSEPGWLTLTFSDGFCTTVDLNAFLIKGIARELLDTDRFNEVTTEPGGGIAWPNGFDACPQFLRELAEKQQGAT